MTTWRDGMGRVTVKLPTGASRRGELVLTGDVMGVCRAPGWLIVYGPVMAWYGGVTLQLSAEARELIADRARKRWAQRHGPSALRDRGYGPPPPEDVEPACCCSRTC